jgi:hypothetical protein
VKVLLGYCILRTVIDADSIRGKTFVAYPHKIYPTREKAVEALVIGECGGHLDTRFNHDAVEVWTDIGGDE